jgi:DNA-binding Lrp family transcriptional regulator
MMSLSFLQQQIINHYQRGFPLTSEPFKELAQQLKSTEEQVLTAFDDLNNKGILSRVGPVFDHKKAGASTLAALAVPIEQLDKIAGIVNQFEQVNHNYAREHEYNLWFVVTAKDWLVLNDTIAKIEALTGLSILVLPMEASYHIDLSFKVNFMPHSIGAINENGSITHKDTHRGVS